MENLVDDKPKTITPTQPEPDQTEAGETEETEDTPIELPDFMKSLLEGLEKTLGGDGVEIHSVDLRTVSARRLHRRAISALEDPNLTEAEIFMHVGALRTVRHIFGHSL